MIHRLKKIWLILNQEERQYALFFCIVGSVAAIVILWIWFLSITIEVPATGGNFREGIVGQPSSLNPLLIKTQPEADLTGLLFSPLSQLTESVAPTKDGRAWSVRLKEGVLWHDGEEVTSDDLVFTIEQAQNPSADSPLFPYWQGARAERLSARETRITPPPNSSPLLFHNHLLRFILIPKHIFESTPPHNWLLSEYNLKPIGNGPYRFEKMVLENNGFLKAYSLRAFAQPHLTYPPYLATITVSFFKNTDSAKAALRYGKIDGLGGVDPYEAKSVFRPAKTILYQSGNYYAVFLNQSQNTLLKELEIRKILSNSIERKTIVQKVLNGYGEPVITPLTRAEKDNPLSTQAVLADLGWVKDENGKLVSRAEVPKPAPPLELTVPELPFLEHTAEILKETWEKLGFTVVLKKLPAAKVAGETIPRRDYQMLLFGNIPQPREDLYPFWHSSQVFSPGLNLSLYKNSQLDTALSDVRKAATSSERDVALSRVDTLLRETVPAIFLYAPAYVYLTTDNLRGIAASSSFLSPADRFDDVAEWHLRTKRILQ